MSVGRDRLRTEVEDTGSDSAILLDTSARHFEAPRGVPSGPAAYTGQMRHEEALGGKRWDSWSPRRALARPASVDLLAAETSNSDC